MEAWPNLQLPDLHIKLRVCIQGVMNAPVERCLQSQGGNTNRFKWWKVQ